MIEKPIEPTLSATSGVLVEQPGRPGFRALRHRNYRLYMFGLVVSFTGTHMLLVAEAWLVYRLTDSALMLGLVGFLTMVPLAPWTLVGGALADRIPRRRLLAITQLGQVLPPLLLAGLTFSNSVQVWHVVLVDLLMGALSALDQPARQAMVVDTVPAEDRDSAVALSAAGFSLARVAGPLAAGLLVAAFGEAVCFAVDGLSFLAVAAALAAMRLPPDPRPAPRQRSLGMSLVDGGRYLMGEGAILTAIALIVVVNLFVVPYQTLLPVFARDILSAGAVGLGLLGAAAGAGAVLGSLAVANLPGGWQLHRAAVLALAASMAASGFAFSRSFLVSALMLVLASGLVVALKILAISVVQRQVRDDMRGRILSIVVLFDAGVPRLGGLAAGALASGLGAPLALGLGAIGCAVSGLLIRLRMPRQRELA